MNFKQILVTGAAGVLVFGGLATVAFAAAFSNGSFESGTNPGSYTTLSVGSGNITNWSVVSGTVDYIGTFWTASDGSRSIDMSGNGAGAISQTFDTIAGHPYKVTFDMAGNPGGGPTVKTMTVDAGGAPTSYSFNITGKTTAAMGWTQKRFDFTATGSTTTLTFTSLVNTTAGPALDNVDITDLMPKQCSSMTFDNVVVASSNSVTMNGTAGRDLLIARGGNNTINGNAGDDCLVGAGGSDTINGGSGSDVILGGNGDDTLLGGAGNDTINGQGGTNTINGGSGIDDCTNGSTVTQCE